jgi:predicted nucleic acid-binding protein
MKLLILLDNTVLSNFAEARLVSVVLSLWQEQAGSTPEALSEYRAGTHAAGLPPSAWEALQIVETAPSEKEFGASLSARLGKGERTCLAVAYIRNGLLATDDMLARRIAARYQIHTIGTLGILVQCIYAKMLTQRQADKALAIMIKAGYRSPIRKFKGL